MMQQLGKALLSNALCGRIHVIKPDQGIETQLKIFNATRKYLSSVQQHPSPSVFLLFNFEKDNEWG